MIGRKCQPSRQVAQRPEVSATLVRGQLAPYAAPWLAKVSGPRVRLTSAAASRATCQQRSSEAPTQHTSSPGAPVRLAPDSTRLGRDWRVAGENYSITRQLNPTSPICQLGGRPRRR